MKKTFILLIIAVSSATVFAQSSRSVLGDPSKKVESAPRVESKKPSDGTKEIYYNCGQCLHSSTQPGKCPEHNYTLIKEGMYHCSMVFDGGISETEGKCPKCGMNMMKMEFRNHEEKSEK
jgi:hypothetical protein